jgi:guanosine-3',5'-bis(diphosphate) 3'-pyrophosphohydrolase
MLSRSSLLDKMKSYDPRAQTDLVGRAYDYAQEKHEGQMRSSGDPYFSHPVAVAEILAGMHLDSATIATALLHDTVEDTSASIEDIQKKFGDEVARLVEGVTKLSKIKLKTAEMQQAENFRKLVLAMSEDIRILMIKLADRLHNMQTLSFLPKPEKRARIAHETLELYAPLAERLGIHDIKDALQDLAFEELHPEARQSIMQRMALLQEGSRQNFSEVVDQLKKDMAEAGLNVRIQGREKKPYSIWMKMQKKDLSFDQLTDLVAFRLIVDSTPNCYAALGVIHSKYQIIPGRFKDYISVPKLNGYRSLHTSVIGPKNMRVEIQIRSIAMHEVAELGIAAHWVYKQQTKEQHNYRWLRELLDVMENASSPEEFLEHTKIAMFQDQVFCFSPAGDLMVLPRGATPVDYAYAVHTKVGDHCSGARINGRLVPLNTVLKNGDQIEIITQKEREPSPAWEQFVVSAKAKSRIRRYVRLKRQGEYKKLGEAMWERTLKDYGKSISLYQLTEALPKLSGHHKLKNTDDLFSTIGSGDMTCREVLLTLHPEIVQQEKTEKEARLSLPKTTVAPKKSGHKLPVVGLIPGMAIHYAKCCHPVPGDRIIGLVTTGKGVSIHTSDCPNLKPFMEGSMDRLLPLSWDAQSSGDFGQYVARIRVILENKPGILGSLCNIIGQNQSNINNLKITERQNDFYAIMLDLDVRNQDHLQSILAALRSQSTIHDVMRVVT